MSNTELIKELRALTQAGMKDCREALEEAQWDLQKAVDIVKVKGLNIADGRSGRAASDGRLDIAASPTLAVMVEVNCQTDFVANSAEFAKFVHNTKHKLYDAVRSDVEFNVNDVEDERKAVVSITKENVVVRRWFAEQSMSPEVRVFAYEHSNHKLGVLLSLQAPSEQAANDPVLIALGDDLAMQIAAMNPLAVSADRLSTADLDRQKAIFETQLQEMNKPQAAWAKIMEGKMRKWNTEVCLLEQESVVVPKTTVAQVIKSVGARLGGEITVVNFTRCQVGEGIEVKKDNLADEVSKLTGIQQPYIGRDQTSNICYPDVKK
jgi:elongation factor Ts